jgi:hypothetical protein
MYTGEKSIASTTSFYWSSTSSRTEADRSRDRESDEEGGLYVGYTGEERPIQLFLAIGRLHHLLGWKPTVG